MDAFLESKNWRQKGGIQQGPGGTTQEKKIMLKLF